MGYTDFADKGSGNYVSWLTHNVDQIYSQSFLSLFSGIECLGMAVFSFVALVLLSPWIGLAAIVLLIIISVLPQLTNKRLRKANMARSIALECAMESYKDVVMGGSIFFLTNLRGRIRERIFAGSFFNGADSFVQCFIKPFRRSTAAHCFGEKLNPQGTVHHS